MQKFFKSVFLVESNELRNFIRFLFLGLFTGALFVAFDATVITYFLRLHETKELINYLLYSSILSFACLWVFTKFQNWVSYSRVASITLLFTCGLVFYLYVKNVGENSQENSAQAMLLLFPINALLLRIYWGSFERIFDIEQIQRLNNKVVTGLYLGAVVTAFTLKSLVNSVDDINTVFGLSFLLCLGVLFFFLRLAFSNSTLYQITENAQYILDKNSYLKLFKKRYVVFLLLFSFISGASFLILEFSFFEVLDDSKTDPVEMFTYILSVLGIIYTFALPIHFFFTQFFIEKYGLNVVLISSVVVLGIFTFLLVLADSYYGYQVYHGEDMDKKYPFLLIVMLATICKLLYMLLHRSIESPAFKMYFMPIDYRLRQNTIVKALGQVRTVGILIAALLIKILIDQDPSAFIHTTYILLGLMVIWGIVTSKLHKEYRTTLTRALAKNDHITELEMTGSEVEIEIINRIKRGNKHEVPSLLFLLKTLNPLIYRSVITSLIESTNERIQKLALHEAKSLSLIEILPQIADFKASKYFQASTNKDLFLETEIRLNAAKARLERAKYLEQLTLSKLVAERSFGATLISYAEEEQKPPFLKRLMVDTFDEVKYNVIVSSANVEDKQLNKMVIEKLGEEQFSNAAVSALAATKKDISPTLDNTFYQTGQTQKVQNRIVQIYGRLKTEKTAELLLEKTNNSNQLISTAAIKELSKSDYTVMGKKAMQIRSALEEECHSLIWNLSIYLDLESQQSDETLLDALHFEINDNYDRIYQLLALLYDSDSIKIVRENIYSENTNDAEFASELLEVIISEELKSLIIPLLSSSSYENKVRKGQAHFPTEPQEEIEILKDLIQADYKNINKWTKASAMMRLGEIAKDEDHKIFIANLVNPDQMLRETAARALYRLDKKGIYKHLNRYKNTDKTVTTSEIITPENLFYSAEHGLAPTLKFEMINFFKSIPEFKEISGIRLLEVAKIARLLTFEQGKQIAIHESPMAMDYYIIYAGSVEMTIYEPTETVKIQYKAGDMIAPIHFLEYAENQVELTAGENVSIYRLKAMTFNELMSYFEEIPLSIIEHPFNIEERELVV